MRVTAKAVAIAASVLLVTGCSANANTNANSTESTGATTITAAYSEGGTTLNPTEANDVTSDTFVLAAYDQLVTYATEEVDGQQVANTSEIVPMIAS